MELLFLSKFNNYFNRKIKYFTDLSDYLSHPEELKRTFRGIQFNPNDGVDAEQILNWDTNTTTPDYLICIEDDEETINSRWFVREWKRTRSGQYRATLRRDVIADHFNEILSAPCFIERGPLSANNKLIYNSEGMSFNQIKKSETLLKDETGEAWIVGYLNRDYADEEVITSIFNADEYPEATALGIKFDDVTNPLSGGSIEAINNGDEIYLGIHCRGDSNGLYFYYSVNASIGEHTLGNGWVEDYKRRNLDSRFHVRNNDPYSWANAWYNKVRETKSSFLYASKLAIQNDNPNITEYDNYAKILDNVTIQHSGRFYRVNVVYTEEYDSYIELNTATYPAVSVPLENCYQDIKNLINPVVEFTGGKQYSLIYNKVKARLSFIEVYSPKQVRVKISNARNHLDDAPYDMYCMKYNLANLALAQQMAQKLSSNLYDTQILPFNPARFINDGILISGQDYSPIYWRDEEQQLDIEVDRVYYCKHSSDSFTIQQEINIPNRTDDEALNIKLSNECDVYRLTSPNYASSFEMNIAKNGGISLFRVDYTYRPISPYIHVAPMFSNLYGDINTDTRGLICGGDFSIDTLSDAWENYQVNNKNYENIFNTNIKKMDTTRNLNRGYQLANIGISTAKGIIGGAIAGGNPFSIGLGAATGAISGAMNQFQSEQAYEIERKYSIDMYNYQLGNVKALPDTLTKVSAYNINNKYFPVVEYYTCSDEEIELMKNKIIYQGYTIMAISTIEDILTNGQMTFIKGQLIRLDDLVDDDHMANEIYNEIYKGVYING